MRQLSLAFLAFVLSVVAPAINSTAQAATITETLTATITGGSGGGLDNLGLFGPQNANLTGDSVTLSFSYDTSLLLTFTPCFSGLCSSYESGNGIEQFDGPYVDGALSESVTINSQAYTITDPTTVLVAGCGPPNGCGPLPSAVEVSLGDSAFNAVVIAFNSSAAYTVGTMFDQQALDSYLATADTADEGNLVLGNGQTGYDILTFGPVTNSTSSTPEPSALALLCVGLALFGFLKPGNKHRSR